MKTLFIIFAFFTFTSVYLLYYSDSFLTHDAYARRYSKLNCSQVLSLISFQDFIGSLGNNSHNWTRFGVIIPDGFAFNGNVTQFCPLAEILNYNPNLFTIAGKTVLDASPICTLNHQNWTIEMLNDYSIEEGKIVDADVGNCFVCDLLPDIFVVNLHSNMANITDLINLKKLRNSAHIPFFTLIKGHSTYCPTFDATANVTFIQDLSCNNLPGRWDEGFQLIPNVTGIYRIISPQGSEYWFDCIWIRTAFDYNLPIHCSNFIRQYLFDIVSLFDEHKIDYRILYGSLLGAIRNRDVIPWTPDADIMPYVDDYEVFADSFLANLPILSKRTYSTVDRFNVEHMFDSVAYVIFPMCPVKLTTAKNFSEIMHNKSRDELIGEQIFLHKQIVLDYSYKYQYRNSGYVDVYNSDRLAECTRIYMFTGKVEFVEISGKVFKTFENSLNSTKCQYGQNFMTALPEKAKHFWNWFIEQNTK